MSTSTVAVIDSPLISVWAYPDRKMIHHVMKAYCFGDEFRAALTRGVEAMERYQATKWLSDDRANGAVVPEDAEWSLQFWLPRARAAGWKHWGLVQPAKIIGQLNMQRAIKSFTDHGINTRAFSDPDLAMRWLDAL
jgi:hypothetical protein